MSRAQELLDLADRVEKLNGADREVDAELAWRLKWRWPAWEEGDLRVEDRPLATFIDRVLNSHNSVFRGCPRYTASIDAAMTVVPNGCLFAVRTVWDKDKIGGFASVSLYESAEHPGQFVQRYWMNEHQAVAATPALALVSAALRAIASTESQND